MAILDYEGFNKETNAALSNWFHFNPVFAVSADGQGPFGYGRYGNSMGNSGRTLAAPITTVWMQGHFYWNTGVAGDVWTWFDSGSTQIKWGMQFDGRVTITYAGGTATTAAPVIALSAWYFVQWKVTIANAGGSSELWINGVQVLSVTGDTQTTANNTVNAWGLQSSGHAGRHANILIYSTAGNAPNSRTPETRIYADLPSGAGASSAWTPLAGSNFQNVDEQPNDGDTTYNSAPAAGLPLDDTYAYPAGTAPASAIVYFVAAEMDCRKDDAGTNELDCLIRSGGATTAKGDTFTLTSSYQRFRSIWDTDPATGLAWTVANANAAEVGVRRKT